MSSSPTQKPEFSAQPSSWASFPLARRGFLGVVVTGAGAMLWSVCDRSEPMPPAPNGVWIPEIERGESIFGYIQRKLGRHDQTLYRQILGAANDYKEGDEAIHVGAVRDDQTTRTNARTLLANTLLSEIDAHPLLDDMQAQLIAQTTLAAATKLTAGWTFGGLRTHLLSDPEADIKGYMVGLSSDVIGCVVKLLTNAELTLIGQKIFNPLPGSKVGSKGYMGARVQPNSPTDNIDDIAWQVFDAFSYAVGDVVLGCNPVSSDPDSVALIEQQLLELRRVFGIEDAISHCVLAHIDVQDVVEKKYPGTTGIWFQSLAGNDAANATFDVSVQKLLDHTKKRTGKYGLYFETGQGADFTNGKDQGLDMVILESRKYGLARALTHKIADAQRAAGQPVAPWLHVNDVAGFIGPEVFRSREQLVRCCLEDIVMGKLHGLTIGLDICSTLHMDVSLDDLDYCIDQIMPACPAYLMALPTKNDPMLGYLTTAFQDHVRIREKFHYKVDDAMWAFYQRLEVIDATGKPTAHFGDPLWVYWKFMQAKGDPRGQAEIFAEGQRKLDEIRGRGVWIAEKFGATPGQLEPALDREIRRLYDDAKQSLWVELDDAFVRTLPMSLLLKTQSTDRKDYVWHPPSGEKLLAQSAEQVRSIGVASQGQYNVHVLVSDGLCAPALSDAGHLLPYLTQLRQDLDAASFKTSPSLCVLKNGRVRAGYQMGELLYAGVPDPSKPRAILHIIGERPGSGHHAYSVYITAPDGATWSKPGTVDHNITRVISGIADTAYKPVQAAQETVRILRMMTGI